MRMSDFPPITFWCHSCVLEYNYIIYNIDSNEEYYLTIYIEVH